MDNNISSILETDRKARTRLESAKSAALESRKKLEAEIEKYREKRKLQTKEHIEDIKEDELRKIKAAVEERERLNKKICKNLDKQYEENHDRWVNELVKRSLK